MKVLLTLEDHLTQDANGRYYVEGPANYSSWSELLEVFDEVLVLARVSAAAGQRLEQSRVDGPGVCIHALPNYIGPWQYMQRLATLRKRVRQAVGACDTYIVRVPGLVGRLVWKEVVRQRRAYGVELVGDPWEALGPGTMPGALRPLFRRIATSNLKKICWSAASVLYWNRHFLRDRYPAAPAAKTFVAPRFTLSKGFADSRVTELRFDRLRQLKESPERHPAPVVIGFIGSLAQLYKGPDILLRALALCRQDNLNFRVIFAGEGRYRSLIESLAQQLCIGDKSVFLGQLPSGGPVSDFLDTIDLFVMPSRTEGLSRALLEAMARGCPCIGSKAGGIPELIAEEDLVPPGDAAALARKIREVCDSPSRMEAMSRRNLARAAEYQPDALRQVRYRFYESLHHSNGRTDRSLISAVAEYGR